MVTFTRITDFRAGRKLQSGSLFSGGSPLALHDRPDAQATVDLARIGGLGVGRVLSTGHDVAVEEAVNTSFVFPMAGTILTETGSGRHRIGGGEAILAGRGARQTRVADPQGGCFHGVTVLIRPDDLLEVLPRLENRALHVVPGGSPLMAQALRLARLLYEEATEGTGLLSRPSVAQSWSGHLTELLTDLLREATGELPPPERGGPTAARHVRQAEAYMRSGLTEIATVADVARELGISARTLETAFRRERDVSPARHLARLRLAEARRLLTAPDGPATVTEVCLDCGIGHAGRFAAEYRRVYGESPGETLARR